VILLLSVFGKRVLDPTRAKEETASHPHNWNFLANEKLKASKHCCKEDGFCYASPGKKWLAAITGLRRGSR
jgi:hypothetical protein